MSRTHNAYTFKPDRTNLFLPLTAYPVHARLVNRESYERIIEGIQNGISLDEYAKLLETHTDSPAFGLPPLQFHNSNHVIKFDNEPFQNIHEAYQKLLDHFLLGKITCIAGSDQCLLYGLYPKIAELHSYSGSMDEYKKGIGSFVEEISGYPFSGCDFKVSEFPELGYSVCRVFSFIKGSYLFKETSLLIEILNAEREVYYISKELIDAGHEDKKSLRIIAGSKVREADWDFFCSIEENLPENILPEAREKVENFLSVIERYRRPDGKVLLLEYCFAKKPCDIKPILIQ